MISSRKLPASLLAVVLLVCLSSLSTVVSFTVIPSRVAAMPTHHVRPPPSSRQLHLMDTHPATVTHANPTTTALHMNFSPPPEGDYGGLGRGKILLAIVMLANIWAFTIPPEFRRARLCNEEDVKLYPERNCTTFKAWRKGVAEYYANGGGINFDFSVEGKE